jgi:LuxR family transcriptional regulator, regulator of acetate metabolism
VASSARRSREVAHEAAWTLERLARDHGELLVLMDRTAALRHVVERVRQATGSEVGLVGLLEDEEAAVLRFWSGTHGPGLHDLMVPTGFGLGGKVLASLRPVVLDDYCAASTITHHFDAPVRSEQIRTTAAVPIVSGGVPAGIIYAAWRDNRVFGDVPIDALLDIAYGAGVALQLHSTTAASTEARLWDDRRRTAVELHDNVGAMLFAIGAAVGDLRSQAGLSPGLLRRLNVIEEQVSDAASALRQALDVLSETPEDRALLTGVQSACRAFENRTGIPAKLIALGDVPALGAARQQVVQRVAREALLNVEKHANAGSVVVTVAGLDDGVTIAVSDDGNGFPADHDGHTGLGLVSLRDSLAEVGGRLSVVNDEDEGTTVRAWVPCL